jgi:CubicO group peptidase (beta-lactamase class C family)
VLVLSDGVVLCEAYAAEGSPEQRMELWSGTKSFVGVMAAAAVLDGLLTLDEAVSSTLQEWREDPLKRTVTIRQLLSLTSGLGGEVGKPPTYSQAVAQPLLGAPGEAFRYAPAAYQVFGALMKRKLSDAGRPADPVSYLQERIFTPIGLGEVGWRRMPDGDPLLPQGAQLTAPQWARFAAFVHAGGVLNGRALVDSGAFSAQFVGSQANPSYGLTWWLPRGGPAAPGFGLDISADTPGLPRDLIVAAGAGSQRLYISRSRKLTVVRLAMFDRDAALRVGDGRSQPRVPAWSDQEFLNIVAPMNLLAQ